MLFFDMISMLFEGACMKDCVLRHEVLLPFGKGWQPPTTEEIACIIEKSGMSITAISKIAGVTFQTLQNAKQGRTKISYSLWSLVLQLAGFPPIFYDTQDLRGRGRDRLLNNRFMSCQLEYSTLTEIKRQAVKEIINLREKNEGGE